MFGKKLDLPKQHIEEGMKVPEPPESMKQKPSEDDKDDMVVSLYKAINADLNQLLASLTLRLQAIDERTIYILNNVQRNRELLLAYSDDPEEQVSDKGKRSRKKASEIND